MIFPEGTLISKDTLPISRKYADKMGYVRFANMNTVHLADGCPVRLTLITPSSLVQPVSIPPF